ncbi:unnamed protein product [Toxocara canis]|uniref:Polypeptide N-acetylgalactosaminyltransferase n=1 Tax=Toxocara canis TaxID=6265 RepID=A0A183UIU3_TOXCA|nr:unnamed protein product [Toxocara canis]
MYISRYIGRRPLRLLQYGILILFIFLVYAFLFAPMPSDKMRQVVVHPRGMLAGVFIGDQRKEMQVEDGADPFATYKNLGKKDWHDYAAMDEESRRVGPGEGGKPVAIPSDPETKKKQEDRFKDELYRANGYDAFVSDLIALNRSVKDIRHKECRNLKYLERLPTVSVIFPFHDEHNSTLLRSVYSVIARSPKDVLKEIILVDDASTKPFLKEPLERFLKNAHIDHIVRVVRTKKREGLIRARQIGAQHATGDVMVFLDAHSEANYNWLPPLVEPITLDYRTVVCPFVDVVDCDTFEYRAQDEGARGSFDWEFNYKRLPLTEDDLKHPTRPFKSPVMAGGYFAISRKWFWELGGYDEGLDIWGGEQYELVAEVWMDEYKKYLYQRRSGTENVNEGDLTKQKAVRERLKCKSFDWFMKEIAFDQDKFYPAVEPKDSAYGELRNVEAQKCVDTQFRGGGERFELRNCISDDPSGGGEQNLRLTFSFDIRPKGRTVCFDVSTSKSRAPIVLFSCHGMQGNQLFKYLPDRKQLFHPVSNLCVDCDAERGELFMDECNGSRTTQQWVWTHVDVTLVEERNRKAGA